MDIKIIDSFATGSRVYGTPKEDSDLDLVVLLECSSDIWKFAEPGSTCRFGKLNLVTFEDKDNFERWRKITKELIARSPVTRDEAIKAFQEAGFGNYGENKES